MGLIVNKLVDSFTIGELYSQLKIEPTIRSNRPQAVHFGSQSLQTRLLSCTAPIIGVRGR